MRVLFADQDPLPTDLLGFIHRQEAWLVDVANDADAALGLFDERRYGVVFIEADLRPNGRALCTALRTASAEVGLIFVAARAPLESKLAAFEAGADDYITKPCDPREIVARAKAVVRRSSRPPANADREPTTMFIGSAGLLTFASRTVSGPLGSAYLTETELKLLFHVQRVGQKGIDGDDLAECAFSRHDRCAGNLVHRHMSNIRKKLQQIGVCDAIRREATGYLLRCHDRTELETPPASAKSRSEPSP